METISWKNVGSPNTPQEIKRSRRARMEMFRKNGQPVLHMHMWNNDDVDAGVAKACPACFESTYGQPRNDCPVCFGVAWVSVENTVNPDIYIDLSGQLVQFDPGTGVRAPRYGGFGPRFLTWIIEPDKAMDVFKIDATGALVKVQNADAYAPWYPDMHDNDLIINVELEKDGATIVEAHDRFQTRMSTPQSIRGWGNRQKSLRQDEYLVGQTFEMTLLPKGNILMQVPVDPDDIEFV